MTPRILNGHGAGGPVRVKTSETPDAIILAGILSVVVDALNCIDLSLHAEDKLSDINLQDFAH